MAADDALPEDYVSYADFGEQFFLLAVTEDRVLGAMESLAGRPIEFGPVGVGPAGLVKVSAGGSIGQPQLARNPGAHVSFLLTVPIALNLLVDLGLDKSRFTATVVVRLTLTARAARPLAIVIHIEPPGLDDVDAQVQADGLRASMLQAVTDVEGEVRKAVARYVTLELDKPSVREARTIDVAAAIAKATGR